jgi:hypothetical protein
MKLKTLGFGMLGIGIILAINGTTSAQWPCASCAPCKRPTWTWSGLARPACDSGSFPVVHPGTTFGYYPTQWQPFPTRIAPARMRPADDVEPLPPPRPADSPSRKRIVVEPIETKPPF